MHKHMQDGMQIDAIAMLRTDGRTNGRTTHLARSSRVSYRAGKTDRWIIRRKVFPWTGELAWRVSHSSLPQGRPLYGSVHLDTWEDALEYVNDHISRGVAS